MLNGRVSGRINQRGGGAMGIKNIAKYLEKTKSWFEICATDPWKKISAAMMRQ